jgi:hypothetical protein
LYNPDHPFHVKAVEELKAISPSISIELTVVAARVPEQFPSAFSDIVQTKAQALYVVEDPIFFAHRTTLLELASRQAHVASDYRRGNRVKAASHVPRLLHLLTAGIGTDATYERSRQMSAH